ncbi:MAG: hypothetical protein ACJ73D_03815 [Pyrinomonadaceae bacterium]
MIKIGAVVLFCLAATVMSWGQAVVPAPAAPVIEDVYLALDDGNGKAGEQAAQFRTSDIPIHCVVVLDNAGKVTVKMNFVAVNVAGVKPETKVVSTTYTTSEKQNRVNFTGTPDGVWTPGRYRVDVFIGAKLGKSVEFDIKASTSNVAAASYLKAAAPQKPKPPVKKTPH